MPISVAANDILAWGVILLAFLAVVGMIWLQRGRRQ